MITQTKLEKHIGAFQTHLESKYVPRSVDTYSKTVRNFLKANPWGDEYKYQDVVDYFGRLSKTKLSISTRKYMLVALKRYYEFLVYARYRKDHPCWGFFIKGGMDKGVIPSDLFTMPELERLMDRKEGWGKQPQRNKLIYSLYIFQAMHTIDIAKLKLDEVDTDKGLIYVRGNTRRNSRELELHPRQYSLVHEYLNGEREKLCNKNSPPVFILNQYGNASSNDSIFDSLLPVKEVYGGRTMNAITIRQSVMSYWINVLKVPVEQVQLLAGIKWVSSIERYHHLTKDETQDVLKKFHPLG
jgi:integrase/recombinase XerD